MKFLPAFLLLGFTAVSLNISAQTPQQKQDPNSYDPKAKAILDDVSKTAKSYTSITATFSLTMEKADKTKDVHEGTIVMKGSKYKISLNRKIKDKVYLEEYINNGKTVWTFSQKDNEVTIDNAPDPAKKKNSNSISPSDIFTIHEKGFKYKFIKEEMQNGKAVQLIDLYPDNPDKKNYSIVKVVIDKAKKQIISVTFNNKDGSKTIYTVKSFTPNLEVADTTFTFDSKTHPGCKSVDLRDEDE